MEKKLFEELSNEIVEKSRNANGVVCLEVNRNTKKDKTTSYYETIYSVYGQSVEYNDDGELTVFDEQGKVCGHIKHNALTKNYDVLSLSCNGEYIGGFDADEHNEKVLEIEKTQKDILNKFNALDSEKRLEVENLINSMVPKKEVETENVEADVGEN